MVAGKDEQLIYEKIKEYVKLLEKSKVPVWRLYRRTWFEVRPEKLTP